MPSYPESPPITFTVGPAEIVSYLTQAGWNRTTSGHLAEIWAPPSNGRPSTSELLVPKVDTAPDFETRLTIVLDDLRKYEQRPIDEIRVDITRQFFDVTNVTAEHDFDSSVFPLDASQKLFFSAKKMVVAAAAATLRRRSYFGKSVPRQAREQAKSVLVGHTRPGSYVVPIISRARMPDPDWQAEEPRLIEEHEAAAFDRRMTVTLARGLGVLHDLSTASEPPTTRDVLTGVGEGLSYDLCDGVIQSLKDPTVEGLEVAFKWAPGIPIPRGAYRGVAFPAESVERIQSVARELKSEIDDRDHVIYGSVELLSSKMEDTGGRVNVHSIISGRHRVVRLELNAEDYEIARASHKRATVVVRGVLHLREGSQATMDVHSFELERELSHLFTSADHEDR